MGTELEKRRLILESATVVFSEKGFSSATISEIAGRAGMVASGVYIYYAGKEEILFTIIENFLTESCSSLQEHLEGIIGSENKLRKAIWFHCREYSRNRSIIKIVLESRSFPRFYQSNAYTALKKYAGFRVLCFPDTTRKFSPAVLFILQVEWERMQSLSRTRLSGREIHATCR